MCIFEKAACQSELNPILACRMLTTSLSWSDQIMKIFAIHPSPAISQPPARRQTLTQEDQATAAKTRMVRIHPYPLMELAPSDPQNVPAPTPMTATTSPSWDSAKPGATTKLSSVLNRTWLGFGHSQTALVPTHTNCLDQSYSCEAIVRS